MEGSVGGEMKQRIKKQISAGTISGRELLKTSRPKQDISFRTGAHMTEKDRPRKKMKPKDYRREDW
jgi:hypothetical protein